jgi:hypothetical protein
LPNDFYTDGLSLFGHESRKAGQNDTLSQFQRALGCLGVSHLVAPDPQSKGKIERAFGFWQKRLPALMRLEGITTYSQANALLAREISWYHKNHISRSTAMTPEQAVAKSDEEKHTVWRPSPDPTLLDLHLSIHHQRVVQNASQISFLGRQWDIANTSAKTVIVVQDLKRFRVISHAPTPANPRWPDVLAEYQI